MTPARVDGGQTAARSVARRFGDANASQFRGQLANWLAASVPEWRRRHRIGRIPPVARDPVAETERVAAEIDWDRQVHAAGYAGLSLPTRFGGRGLGLIEEAIFYEECARARAPEGITRISQHTIAPLIVEFGTPDQQAKYLPGILSATEIWCQGSSEPNAGSDLAAVGTTGVRAGDSYRITGRKTWTGHAHYADRCWLLARTSTAKPKYHNLTLLLVDMHQPGVTVRPIRQLTGEYRFNEMTFDSAITLATNALGPVDEGWRVINSALTRERGVLQAMRRYMEIRRCADKLRACRREQGDGAGRDLEVETKVELVRWHARRCIEERIAGQETIRAQAVFKLYWSELWQAVAQQGLALGCQAHEDYWRHAYLESRSVSVWGGTSQIQRNIIAERVLGLPRG